MRFALIVTILALVCAHIRLLRWVVPLAFGAGVFVAPLPTLVIGALLFHFAPSPKIDWSSDD